MKVVNIVYNREGIGDTLIISLQDISLENRTFERQGDVVRVFDKESNVTTGYNIFHASTYIELTEVGAVTLTEELVRNINSLLGQNGIAHKLDADFSPKFVVGYVKAKEKHPNADKLSVCQVDVREETLQIVCGAPNVDAGQKVVVAKIGAVMPSGLVIKPTELRGIQSSGMICSARELDLPNAPQEKGILVLENKYEAGVPFPV
jgi:tRNA-binding protein